MSSRIRRWLPLLALLLPLAVPDAGAIVLGPIRSDSRVGEVVRAEVAIEEHPAERFDPACLRLYRPPSASDDQAWLTAARLSYRRDGGRSQLDIVSLARLNEPVVHIGVRSQCADGAARSYTLSLAAAAAKDVGSSAAQRGGDTLDGGGGHGRCAAGHCQAHGNGQRRGQSRSNVAAER
jgi:hypothetical protein